MAELHSTDPFSPDGDDEIKLELRQYPNAGKPRVLLLHGASACHQTFLFPNGKESLTGYLLENDFEPWLLDWCGSNRVLEKYQGRGKWEAERFDFDKAAEIDLPWALEKINETDSSGYPDMPVTQLIGFCMGGAVIAQSIAAGHLQRFGISHVVLLAIGLFYRSTGEGKLKVQDHVLDRLLADDGKNDRFIDSRCHEGTCNLEHPWPPTFEALYHLWPGNFQPHRDHAVDKPENSPHVAEQCNRVTFMFGQPYSENQLLPELHESTDELRTQFGAIALRMYAQAARNTRRGWAAELNAESDNTEGKLIGAAARKQFDALDQITLITGQNNRIWQRDSIDSMHEWLLRGTSRGGERISKHILYKYGHQDLLWGKNSKKDVFPKILEGLAST